MNAPGHNRPSITTKLTLAAVFVILLIGVAVWLGRSLFMQSVIKAPPDVLAAVRQATASKHSEPPGMQFSGRVVDAMTHQPVKAFTVQLGWNDQYIKHVTFLRPKAFTNGRYSVTARQTDRLPNWYIRIEAHGYLPAVTPSIQNWSLPDIALTPAKDLKGRVFNADGSPAAGVQVALASTGEYVILEDGKFQDPYPEQITGLDGRFDFPPQSGRIIVVALNSAGIAIADQDSLARSTDLHLQPYGRIKGRLADLVSSPTPPSVAVMLDIPSEFDWTGPSFESTQTTHTSRDGDFQFDHVPPGELEVYRLTDFGVYKDERTPVQMWELKPGQEISVQLGGDGRRVVGHCVVKDRLIAYTEDRWCTAYGMSVPVFAQMPDKVKYASPAVRQLWIELFGLTPAGREYLAAHPQALPRHRRYMAYIDDNGDFQMDDVAPGEYQFEGFVEDNTAAICGTGSSECSVPYANGDTSRQPFKVPDIVIRSVK